MAGSGVLDDFEAIFGEAMGEWEPGIAGSGDLRPFLFQVHAADESRVEVVASDFHSFTWQRFLSVHELEDLVVSCPRSTSIKENIGIGGSLCEFVDYFIASLLSGDVKVVLGSLSERTNYGYVYAKLMAHKSKGLPCISISLNRLTNSSANDAMANIAVALLKAVETRKNDVVKEQLRSMRLTGCLTSEREKNESLRKQLGDLKLLSRQKPHVPKGSDEMPIVPILEAVSDSSSYKNPLSGQLVTYSRSKVRGIFFAKE